MSSGEEENSDLFDIFRHQTNNANKRKHRYKVFREQWANDPELRARYAETHRIWLERKRLSDQQKNWLFLRLVERFGNEELKELVREIEELNDLTVQSRC
jgi:hypothetical protein